ncbi:hypothetical protein GCM10023334_010680 [Nonomuraea thailandensis]
MIDYDREAGCHDTTRGGLPRAMAAAEREARFAGHGQGVRAVPALSSACCLSLHSEPGFAS